MSWSIILSRQAAKDAKRISQAGLKPKAQIIFSVLQNDPLQNPPRYKKLVGNFSGFYSRRINIQHRLVYQIFPEKMTVHILRMWSHYE